MSDTSLGPGWWESSDGRWYPPELRRPPTAPKSQSPASSPAQNPVEPEPEPEPEPAPLFADTPIAFRPAVFESEVRSELHPESGPGPRYEYLLEPGPPSEPEPASRYGYVTDLGPLTKAEVEPVPAPLAEPGPESEPQPEPEPGLDAESFDEGEWISVHSLVLRSDRTSGGDDEG